MDIAELGYKVDSSGLVEGNKALDEATAAADRAGGAASRLERDYQALSRTIERSSGALGDRLGGALDRIGAGTGSVIAELQSLNRTNVEILAALGQLDGKAMAAAGSLEQVGAAGRSAATGIEAAATASQQLEAELAQQQARYRSVAQQAMAWADSSRTAGLSERALAEAARESTSALNARAMLTARAGTEQERMVARAQALQDAETRTAQAARAAAAAAQAQEVNLRQLLGQIDPTIAALDRLADMEARLERAAGMGLIKPQVFQQYQAQIDATRQRTLQAKGGLDQLGMSARQTAAALRMVPAQVTDIATSLISGQPLWMVAIQQGGQLKDQLGGLGPALKAVATYVLGLINPLTLAGAGLAAFVVAAKQGQEELFEFQKGLLLSGRDADLTSGQFAGLVEQIDRLQGVSRGQAVSALTEVGRSGRFAGEQFTMVAAAAARMEAATGQAIGKTVEAFQAIAKDPLEALAKLNEQEGFLTRAQIDRIEALQREGHEQEAVAEALQLYASHLDNVADRSEAVMPPMLKWWRDIKDEISGAWGEVITFSGEVEQLGRRLAKFLPGTQAQFGLIATLASPRAQMQRLNSILQGVTGDPDQQAFAVSADGRKAVTDYVKVLEEQRTAEKAASEALDTKIASLDRAAAKQQAYNKIVELYNRIPDNDARHFDGSMQRLIGQAYAQVDKQFDQRQGLNRRNGDDSSAASLLANIQRQITANEQLAETGEKVTASDRLAIQARQLLADETNTMTAATRKLLQAILPELAASEAKAEKSKQNQRDLAAEAALTERLMQLEQLRREDTQADLMAIGRGADATEMLRRQLDIQRDYLREREKLEKAQRDPDTALSAEGYQRAAAALEASLGRSLEIERGYQQQRMAMLADWRTGFTRGWEDYVFAAANASDQAAGLLTNGLNQAEDAFVRFVQTGKLSFKDLANSVIADLARIAAKQTVTGLFGGALSRWIGGGGGSGVSSTYGAQSFGNNTDWLTSGLSFGGGRANGGGVSGSSFYEVGEKGRPELFEQNGKKYLIPGNRGTVVPAAAGPGNGGMGTPQVNVTVHGAPAGATATARANPSGGVDVEVFLQQLEGRMASNLAAGASPINSALEGRYDVAARV